MKTILLIIKLIVILVKFTNGNYHDFKLADFHKISGNLSSLNDWIEKLNHEYQILNKYSAHYVWELNMDPLNQDILDDATKLRDIRIKWKNNRCNEIETLNEFYQKQMTISQRRMFYLLCRGPKYTEYQANQLSEILDEIQNIYVNTKICLPETFDICVNYNRIWKYTYVEKPNGDVMYLDMSSVIDLEKYVDYNSLNFFNRTENLSKIVENNNINDDYYVIRENKMDYNEIDKNIRESSKICMSIEPELENLMTGDFSVFQRSDCTFQTSMILHWAWESWRLSVAKEIGNNYPNAVYLMNLGAKNNGYNDIGECWREELETNNLRSTVEKLWYKFKPYYKKLHAVLRNALLKKYSIFNNGQEKIQRNGPLPAHLLGNMWAQDWSVYADLLNPFAKINLDDNFMKLNWTILDMVKRSDDFYSSLGLNHMTLNFWKYSKFNKITNLTKCHGSASNMFSDTNDDYRMIYCAEQNNLQDFYVIIHEMGHLQYYMKSSENQPPLFQDSTNSAFGEAIGDAIFLAIMSPQHLNRLKLLPDEYLYEKDDKIDQFIENNYKQMRIVHEIQPNHKKFYAKKYSNHHNNNNNNNNDDDYTFIAQNYDENPLFMSPELLSLDRINENLNNYIDVKENEFNGKTFENDKQKDYAINPFDLTLLLRIALSKLPQIPYEFILDIFRWDLFSGDIPFSEANNYYWKLRIHEQGIRPPMNDVNRKDFFDIASKFHISDNTPYVRYFLASFLQAQIFKGLCEKTIFNEVNTNKKLPMPLHKCDIYGSKRAGKLLKKALSEGASTHWTKILYILTGKNEITIDALIEYYEPLFKWIDELIENFDIHIGW